MLLCIVGLWFIWLGQNGDVIPCAKKIAPSTVKAKIWYQTKQHLQMEWAKLQTKIKEGQMNRLEAQITFEFDFGKGGTLFRVDNGTLSFNLQPPPPD